MAFVYKAINRILGLRAELRTSCRTIYVSQQIRVIIRWLNRKLLQKLHVETLLSQKPQLNLHFWVHIVWFSFYVI